MQLDFTCTLSYISTLPKGRLGVAGNPVDIPACFLRHEFWRLTSANTLLNFTRAEGIQGILLALSGCVGTTR
jgi:hypothetical protein